MGFHRSQFSPGARRNRQLETTSPDFTTQTSSGASISPQSQASAPSTSKFARKRLHKHGSEPVHTPSSRNTQRDAVPKSANKQELARTAATDPSMTSTTSTTSSERLLGSPLPKATINTFPSRLARPETATKSRTPSLVSGSSASTADSTISSLPRRKHSLVDRHRQLVQIGPMTSQDDIRPIGSLPEEYKDPYPESVLGITLPSTGLYRRAQEPERYDVQHIGFDESHASAVEDSSPPTTSCTLSVSPSTGFSGSPSPFSHASTPTSMSSHSPEAVVSPKAGSQARQATLTSSQLPMVDRETEENGAKLEQRSLSYVHGSSSSSSASTVKASEGGRQVKQPEKSRLLEPRSDHAHAKPSAHTSKLQTRESAITKPKVSPVCNSQRVIQRPPELAHLADASAVNAATGSRPARPSREGTEGTYEILRLREASPVIQSNMSRLPDFSHRRQSSSDSQTTGFYGFATSSRTRLVKPMKSSTRNPSPSPSVSSTFSPVSSPPPVTRKPTPDMSNDRGKPSSRGTSPAPPSPGKLFGFFTRRTKTEPGPPGAATDKKSRRGPMAGTGHEGYGRFGFRGRSGSTTSGSIDRSISADSSTASLTRIASSCKSSRTSEDTHEVDDFLLGRQNPLPLRGESDLNHGSSQTTKGDYRPSSRGVIDAHDRSSNQPTSEESTSDLASTVDNHRMPKVSAALTGNSSLPEPFVKHAFTGLRAPSGEENPNTSPFPTVAPQGLRYVSQSQNAKGNVAAVPAATNAGAAALPFHGDTGRSQRLIRGAENAMSHTDIAAEDKEDHRLEEKQTDAQPNPRSKLSRKWNFFQRAQASPKSDSFAAEKPVSVSTLPPSRFVAHYALVDSSGALDVEDLEKIMQEADSDDQASTEPGSAMRRSSSSMQHGYRGSVLLPSLPSISMEYARPHKPAFADTTPPNKRSSSPQSLETDIDSRPNSQVYSAYDASGTPSHIPPSSSLPQPQPPSRSFSRPFASTQRPPALPPSNASLAPAESGRNATRDGQLSPEVVTKLTDTASPDRVASNARDTNTIGESRPIIHPTTEFFAFPSRHDSDVSYSSSSGTSNFRGYMALRPPAGAPASEDEVWGEYDDLIDDVTQPKKSISTSASSGPPEYYTGLGMDNAQSNIAKGQPFELREHSERLLTIANTESFLLPDLRPLSSHSVRPLSNPPAVGTPNTSISFTDFYADYGERNLSVSDVVSSKLGVSSADCISTAPTNLSSQSSLCPISRADVSDTTSTQSHNISNVSEYEAYYRDKRMTKPAETEDNGLESKANLRFSALMTSKWLSFGRVLFSPAHEELKGKTADRVLVLDGLGKDWSYYCALTYPNASIYNLGPNAFETPNGREAGHWQSLPNHRHIYHPNMSSPFPFPRGYFAAVVFRFPTASSEAAYRAALFECKRVLQPGGYLEISVLDIDLANMGNRARRTVRALKVRMQAADPAVSLKPVSDNIQRLLGRRGFENLNRCMLALPVAGPIPGSADASPLESESNEVDFSDLLKDQSREGDEGIAKMVVKVGRWWYSQCYEVGVLPGGLGEQGIWADETLLRECEERQTSFRLLICYAQKPTVPPRRTVSV